MASAQVLVSSPITSSSPSILDFDKSLSEVFRLLCATGTPGGERMGSARRFADAGHGVRGQMSIKKSLCHSVLLQIVQQVEIHGYTETVCGNLRKHFAALPARYALNVDPMRYEDVLLHMRLLNEAREAESYAHDNPSEPFPLPNIHVRKVLLASTGLADDAEDDDDTSVSRGKASPSIHTSKFPKPAFGSNLNLSGLVMGSPSSRRGGAKGTPISRSSPTPPSRFTPPGRPPRPRIAGTFTDLAEMDEDDSRTSSSSGHQVEAQYGWEVTVATADRHGLLKYLTMALSSSALELNIREAHVFSSTDEMALEVFVVEGWPGNDPQELQQAILNAILKKLEENNSTGMMISEEVQLADLRKIVEQIAYEDWAVDYNQIALGERLGGGSSGRLYRGVYRGQDVAVKIIVLAETQGEGISNSLRAAPATELLQMFKQEVSIMRLVRHKNLLQFIGACSSWPKLCIVTELMAGGSVRDIMQNRGSGLDSAAATKVLRDTARGMDFLHRRGIVHRDLKAANLLIDEHDVVKVCDFGVARLKPLSAPESHSGEDKRPPEMTAETGTYRWMAPEVLEHRFYDHKADVYSFGIMIWEVLTGEVPYTGLTPLQAAIGVVQRGLRPVMPVNAPPRLVELAERCWHQRPELRPEFSEILVILEEVIKPSTAWKRSLFGGARKRA